MRILIVTPNFPPAIGGTQNYSAAVADSFFAKGHQVEVLAASHPDAKKHDEKSQYSVIRTPDPGDNFAFSAHPKLVMQMRRFSPDIVFATHWSAAFAAHAGNKILGQCTPVICAAHAKELFIDPLKKFAPASLVYRSIRKKALQKSHIFPVSHFTGDAVKSFGVDSEQITVVPNGVDPNHFSPRDASAIRKRHDAIDKNIVLTVTRLVSRKGIDTILEAWASLENDNPNTEYWIVGDGPGRERLEKLTASLELKSVRFIGRVKYAELIDYYNAADIFVMAPRNENGDVEGFGLVFLEASSCQKAVIGTRSGGVPDAIQDGKTGLLVEPGDAEAMAQAIQTLLDDEEKRRTFGKNGRKWAENEASWSARADQMLEVMQSLVERVICEQ